MTSSGAPDYWLSTGGRASPASLKERRSTIKNDDDIEDGTTPGSSYTAETYKGKFFPRGCRGIIEQLQIYCKRTSSGDIELRYSPYPNLGPVGTLTVTPGASWAWKSATIEKIWNYDSLFIWVYTCDADVSWGYDAAAPPDGHSSDDSGATWEDVTERPFIRAVLTGETPGDIPVSGVVNAVKIPAVASRRELNLIEDVPHNTMTEIVDIEGAGTLLEATFVYHTSEVPTAGNPPATVYYLMRIVVDGVVTIHIDNSVLTQSQILTSGRCAIGAFFQTKVADPAYNRTQLKVWMPIEFRRSLSIWAMQTTGAAVDVYGAITANMLR